MKNPFANKRPKRDVRDSSFTREQSGPSKFQQLWNWVKAHSPFSPLKQDKTGNLGPVVIIVEEGEKDAHPPFGSSKQDKTENVGPVVIIVDEGKKEEISSLNFPLKKETFKRKHEPSPSGRKHIRPKRDAWGAIYEKEKPYWEIQELILGTWVLGLQSLLQNEDQASLAKKLRADFNDSEVVTMSFNERFRYFNSHVAKQFGIIACQYDNLSETKVKKISAEISNKILSIVKEVPQDSVVSESQIFRSPEWMKIFQSQKPVAERQF